MRWWISAQLRNLARWIEPVHAAPSARISKAELSAYAADVVAHIERDPRFRAVVEREGNIAFCPRCGQRPLTDYRREEAFQMILAKFPEARRSDINRAIENAHGELE